MTSKALQTELQLMGSHLNEAFKIYVRLTKKMELPEKKTGLSTEEIARFLANKNKKRIICPAQKS